MAMNRIQKIAVAGGCMFVFSILFQTAILPPIVKSMVRKKVALKNGWMMRDVWGKFPFSFEFQFYIFNITNPDEIKNGDKPIVKEVGPFVYDEWQEKTNQMDHDEDDTVSYTLRNTYYFNAEKSNSLTGDEELIVPHYFALGIVNAIIRDKPSALPILGKAIDSILKKPDNIFIKVKAKNILFDGIVIDCNVNDFAGSAICTEVGANYEEFRLKLVGENQYAMSLWGSMNATDSRGRTRVYRGLKNIMDVGKVVEYNNKPNISVWDDDYCDKFNGTDGTVFHPYFDKKGSDDIVAFNPNLCRSISCYFDSKTSFAGLKLLRYTTDIGTDAENNPRHKCYCETPDNCLKKGAYDIFKCNRAPLVVTNPHFYLADPYYISTVEGLNPVKEKHMLIVDLDPFTGSPVHVHTRAQFNMFIQPVNKFKLMKSFPTALLPLMWFDEIIILPDYLIKEIKNGHRQITMAKVFQYLMMFGGLGMGGYAGFMHYKSTHAENNLSGKSMKKHSSADRKVPMTISTVQAATGPPNVD